VQLDSMNQLVMQKALRAVYCLPQNPISRICDESLL
jgi:hypothetical protein